MPVARLLQQLRPQPGQTFSHSAPLEVEKRIRDEQALVVLAVIEVLAEDFGTAGSLGGSQNSSIPIGNLETFFDGKRSLEYSDRILVNAKTEPLFK